MAAGDTTTEQSSQAEGQLSPKILLGELHAMLAALDRVSAQRPQQTTRCMLELSEAMKTVTAAIEKGYCTPEQLSSVSRRRAGLERQVQ